MKILVPIKQVPDTETKIRIGPDGRGLDESGVKWVISPYDEYALEAALQLREAGSGEVIVACAGRESAQTALRQALAMGADGAVLIADERFERADGVVRARALAAVARETEAELVLAGKYGVGSDEGQTGPMIAELLDWPHAAGVGKLAFEAATFRAEREIEGAVEIIEGRLPAVITCDKGLNEPRLPSLKGIMQAKKKPLDTWTLEQVGLEAAALASPMLVWESLELPAPRAAVRRIEGTPAEAARELVRTLREEGKVL